MSGHKVGVLDAGKPGDVAQIVGEEKAQLLINDPPYNVRVGKANTRNLFKIGLRDYMAFSRNWVANALTVMDKNAHFYAWMGADYRDGFQPLPDFMIMMREFDELRARNYITVRNQRGYGTQKNYAKH